MSLNAKSEKYKSESKFKRPDPLEPGTYPARVVQIISLGLQPQRAFKGEEKDPKYMLYVTYELLDEFMKGEEGEDIEDKPRWLSEDFALHSLEADLATSTKRYLSLDPQMEHDGDWSKLAGTPCMVTITKSVSKKDKDKIYNNVSSVSIMRAKEAAKAPDLVNPPKVFDIDEPDVEIFLSFPEWLQKRIKENLEYEGSALEEALTKHEKGEKKSDNKNKEKKRQDSDDEDQSEASADEGDDDENW